MSTKCSTHLQNTKLLRASIKSFETVFDTNANYTNIFMYKLQMHRLLFAVRYCIRANNLLIRCMNHVLIYTTHVGTQIIYIFLVHYYNCSKFVAQESPLTSIQVNKANFYLGNSEKQATSKRIRGIAKYELLDLLLLQTTRTISVN